MPDRPGSGLCAGADPDSDSPATHAHRHSRAADRDAGPDRYARAGLPVPPGFCLTADAYRGPLALCM